jgi:hypothetical protein
MPGGVASRRAAAAGALLLVVHISSERARQAVRQDCSFAKKLAPMSSDLRS